jgi:hypothetical protein
MLRRSLWEQVEALVRVAPMWYAYPRVTDTREEPMTGRTLNRREALKLGAAAVCGVLLPPRLLAAETEGRGPALDEALAESDLIYVTPLHADGRESTCQAEIWYVAEGRDAYVVTASNTWRARAVEKGLSKARAWVGDVGVWSRSNGAYRELPQLEMQASLVTDAAEHARVLEIFGDKYSLEWVIWGRRFRNGLADGSRVMLHYQPV